MSTAEPPQEALFPAPESDDDLSSYFHRQFIGSLGLVLPVLLWLVAGLRPTDGLPRWGVLSSVSAYYYTGSVAALVGILIVLAGFLFTYRGYNNEHRLHDRVAAIVAGGAAVLVAFFPVRAPSDSLAPSWWTPRTGALHHVSAVVLFGAFIFFSLFLFPKTKVKTGEPLPRDKRTRNGIYISCGVAMVICMVWAGSALFTGASIFWPEALALEFFAVSWLVKGRADRTAVAAARRTVHYGRHPRQLVGDVWSAILG
jgi:hypothetical protein